MKWLKELWQYRGFLIHYTASTVKLRYRNAALGIVWIIMQPALYLLVLSIVFSKLNRWDMSDFSVYLFAGLVPWRFFEAGTLNAMEAVTGNTGYLTKIYVPALIFPVIQVATALVDFFFSFIVLLCLLAVFKPVWSMSILFLPVSFIIVTIFTMGVGLIFSTINVFFRDFRQLAGIVLTLVFFSSPILFKADRFIDGPYSFIVLYNPIVYFVDLFQQPIYYNQIPGLWGVLIALTMALVSLVMGLAIFLAGQRRFFFYL